MMMMMMIMMTMMMMIKMMMVVVVVVVMMMMMMITVIVNLMIRTLIKKTCSFDGDYDDHEILGLFIMAKVNACIWLAFELLFAD